jgi:hypothetical protein
MEEGSKVTINKYFKIIHSHAPDFTGRQATITRMPNKDNSGYLVSIDGTDYQYQVPAEAFDAKPADNRIAVRLFQFPRGSWTLRTETSSYSIRNKEVLNSVAPRFELVGVEQPVRMTQEEIDVLTKWKAGTEFLKKHDRKFSPVRDYQSAQYAHM